MTDHPAERLIQAVEAAWDSAETEGLCGLAVTAAFHESLKACGFNPSDPLVRRAAAVAEERRLERSRS